MSTLEKYSKDTDRSLSVDSGLEVGDGEKATQETDVIAELKGLYYKVFTKPHLSPGVSLISDLAHDSGILPSELFTSRSQNLVLAKLPNSGFWRYGQFFK